MTHIAELTPLLPLIGLAATVIALVVAVAIRRHHETMVWISLLGLAVSFWLLAFSSSAGRQYVTLIFQVDAYSRFFVGLLLATAAVVVLLSHGYLRTCSIGRHHAEEYYILLLLATLGSSVLVTSCHFISFFLGLEILSVSLYGLIAYTRGRMSSIEAGVKYLILAAVSSAFLVLGMAMLYARLGTMSFPELAASFGGGAGLRSAPAGDPVVLAGLGLMLVGFGFKLAVVPFHMWTPDVYQGAPAPVTAFVATASKGAIVALLVRFAAAINLSSDGTLWLMLAVISGVSMFAGNLLALLQRSIKRLLAYSSIAHLGYLLVAFLASGGAAAQAVTFYLVAYTITTLGSFGVVTVLSEIQGRDGDLDDLAGYRGLGRRRPWLAGVMTAMLLSLAGIPLTAGFIGKYLLLAAGVESSLWTLVLILAINSAIGIYYYLRVIVVMYLQPEDPATSAHGNAPAARVSTAGSLALSVVTILLVWLGICPNFVLRLVQQSCVGLF